MIHHYRNLWSECVKNGGESKAMLSFQERCTEVPKWNQDTIDENVNKLLDSCRCDYLEELMAAVFIAHTKVLIAIRVSSKHKKLQITLPKLDHFLHRVFSECARGFWKAPFLFLSNQQPIEMQKNLLQAESLCNEGISSAVRSLLPIKNILNEYLSDEVNTPEPLVEDVSVHGSDDDEKIRKPKHTTKGGSEKKEVETKEVETKASSKTEELKDNAVPEPQMPIVEQVMPVAAPVEQTSTTVFPDVGDNKILVTKLDSDADVKPVIMSPPSKVEEKVAEAVAVAVAEEELIVDTKPTVHFNNYDNVFDETNDQANSFKYAPKDIELGESPVLEIKEDIGTPLSLDASVMSLETPGADSQGGMGIMADTILE
jgi:hypothetical protein